MRPPSLLASFVFAFAWLALGAAGCGLPGPLPQFPPHAPAPEMALSLPAIESRFRAEGTESVKVEMGPPYQVSGGVVESVVITLSPAPPALVEAAFRYGIEGYLAKYRDVLAIRPFMGWAVDAQRRVVFEEKAPPIETGCRKITVGVDFDIGQSPSVAHIVRTCGRRLRAPAYASRRLPAMPPEAKGVVLECIYTGGGAVFIHGGLAIDDYGDVYKLGFFDSFDEPLADYVRTIPPDEMEEATGLAVLALREPEVAPDPGSEPEPNRQYSATVGVGCSMTLSGKEISLGAPGKPDRRGPATRALLRWLDARGMILRD